MRGGGGGGVDHVFGLVPPRLGFAALRAHSDHHFLHVLAHVLIVFVHLSWSEKTIEAALTSRRSAPV
jgi:hypothetical protein